MRISYSVFKLNCKISFWILRKISIKVSICWLYSFNVVITKFLSTEDITTTFKSQYAFMYPAIPGVFSSCAIVFVCVTTMLNSKIVEAVGWLIRGRGGVGKREIFFLPSPLSHLLLLPYTCSKCCNLYTDSPTYLRDKIKDGVQPWQLLLAPKYPHIVGCSFYIACVPWQFWSGPQTNQGGVGQ